MLAGVRSLTVSRLVAAPPDVVWDLLVTVDRWPAWGPSVRAVELGTPRIALGSRGVVTTVVGARLPFEVTVFDGGHRWAWRVANVPATDHRVEAVDGATRVTFGVPWPAAPYLAVCAAALRRIERLAIGTVTPKP